ncbi:MAG: transcription-repair coupling factor [Acidobacteria bacterium]|jgi:transcription-repair coupling factor (superfamily II helicase)|nr:transcription-repair coupling factor [Acidobacteriota bacterium]
MSFPAQTKTELSRLKDEIRGGAKIISLSGLTSIASKAYILTQLQAETNKTFVIVTDSNKEIETWECDLEFWQNSIQNPKSKIQNPNGSQLLVLPSSESDVYAGVSPHAETLERRALTLWTLANSKPNFVVTSAKSLITRTVSPDKIKNLGAILKRDEDFAPENLIEKLVSSGFVREEPLKNIGEFSVRGGIVDVWSPSAEMPVRIEFFGDTVDSIREFDAETQLSTNQLKETSIAPMREFSATAQDFKDWAFFARERFTDEKFARAVLDRTQFADEGESFSGWEFMFPLISPRSSSVFDYLKDSIFVIDEPSLIELNLSNFYENVDKHFNEITEAGEIGLEPRELFLSVEQLRDKFELVQRLELRSLGRTAAQTDEEFQISESSVGADGLQGINAGSNESLKNPLFLFSTVEKSTEIEIGSRSTRKFHGNIRDFAQQLKQKNFSTTSPNTPGFDDQSPTNGNRQPTSIFVLQTHGLADRLNEILREYDVSIAETSLLIGDLSAGFEIPAFDLNVSTETEIFGETRDVQSPKSKVQSPTTKSKTSAFISDFRDLKAGDFVVHVDHGIGRFEGLQTLETGGVSREFMLIIYAENTKLFVPVERLDLVSRYSSGEAAQPTLDRLGSIGWQKTKAKAKRAMRDMADELLRLYAERKLVEGFAFSEDTPWQIEFEDAFPYQLTVDQASTIEDMKGDMQTPVPMDRLVVGDVGYGKTEVAMRGAFKAIMDNKQVAILTPTTVLAYQHFETFKQRFAAFPAKIELLSRFRSKKEQKEVVEKAEKGEVDILIGTHRILSNDVKLPKLGLVVVDEEQRFGVGHKEKLKHLKKKVDVLTLSATPIPRTLNMSLLGMRDMSVIETPPRDRLAINTQVVQFSENVIKSAIELELARSGQVFFIHNRVETIYTIAAHIQKIVPNARIIVAHGQMNEKEMEQAMLDFIAFKFDILVATTIIENGIDIPRANTIIINRADNYGLSQLYQLRGRVGRSNRRAYSYLLIPSEQELTPIAKRRLSAIREFSDLGAGFRIAALDLELRGAGNILGGQQSGQLDALGFDLYTKMLERTIAELKGEEIEDETSVSLNLGADVSIPNDYINETAQRLRTYKRISSAGTEEDLRRIFAELQDRYGKTPESVENLFEYARLRRIAEKMHVLSVDKTTDGFAIKLDQNAKVSPNKLTDFLAGNEGASFSPSGILKVSTKEENLIEKARQILEQLRIKN